MKDKYELMVMAIIEEQELIVGPLAWEEAGKVRGLRIHDKKVVIRSDGMKVVETLVKQYEKLFGKTSVEVCRDAVKKFIAKLPKKEIPKMLQ